MLVRSLLDTQIMNTVGAENNITILNVEDDKDFRRASTLMLTDVGFRVLEVGNGSDALILVGQARIDIVICDLGLPVMGGEAFLTEFRKIDMYAYTPVIMLSGRSRPIDFNLAVEEWMIKPFQAKDLTHCIYKLAEASPDIQYP